MKHTNAVGWFDIYVTDLERAGTFYEAVFGCKLQTIEDPTSETQMLAFSAEMSAYGASGALVKSPHGRPGAGGTMVYFSVEDCSTQEVLVSRAGGVVLRPKFSIGAFGWVTLCLDTEGNQFGLNSMQ